MTRAIERVLLNPGSVAPRFWAKVKIGGVNECWEWQASKRRMYGKIRCDGEYWLAHRVVWVMTYGQIPEGKLVLHHCDHPGCVNPKHLFLGTTQDNYKDMVSKNRDTRRTKTHCLRGHLRTEENTYRDSHGWRRCIQCNTEAKRKTRKRKLVSAS